jgi:hypothetical protein
MRWEGHVAHTGREAGKCTVLLGKPEGKKPLRRPRRCWESDIEMNLKEIDFGGVDMIGLAHRRKKSPVVVNPVMNFRVS